ncbi:LOW QUALITY PROTEIN: putative olfactory receptor 1F12P [Suncus etruscus]|uniref:LOW QUALITY PROTEIN: putative olfactory receptor 1F12P n=1 Tax=Suncus etruscus TaxID=109475 RepID=UPI0021104DA1|nr:LOW QUALITY PROTEIN: putative olfactory receptor 1F12P [Suncus etruscus]
MEPRNVSSASKFILLGLSSQPERQDLIFGIFLVMYLVGAAGNLLIALAISADTHLHTLMYLFLSNLSLVDFCFLSATVPKMLVNISKCSQSISYGGCLSQIYFCVLLANMDNFLLADMAYDRYMAICHPLSYSTKMSHTICALLLGSSWLVANAHSLLHTLLMAHLNFCARNVLPYFYCDLSALLQLSCSDTCLNQLMILLVGSLITLLPFLGILGSYVHIVGTVLKVPSQQGKRKAFSTCSSHLTVISLFYGTITGVYLSPSAAHSEHQDSLASVIYMVVTPMLNPFIYCLRNKDMKGALFRLKTFSVM